MYYQSDAYTLVPPDSQAETRPAREPSYVEDREQTLVNTAAIALLLVMGLAGGLAAWLFLSVS